MGNLQSLTRGNQSYNMLSYGYYGNQLTSVTGSGFSSRSYGYDPNGNATSDGQGHGISYNMLNLPANIPGLNMTYTYDATGQKLRKISNSTVTEYIDGIQYTGNTIDFVQTEEGRVLNPTGTPNFEYTLTDHLGNNRVTFDSSTGAGSNTNNQLLPFGLVSNQPTITSPPNKYFYNKKEIQEELTQYDYGARFYDPVIGRFNTIDRYAEKYDALTPYQYGGLNPINTIDMNGDFIKIIYNHEAITYQSGKLYGADGKEYKGKSAKLNKDESVKGYKGFLKDAKGALDQIGAKKDGNELLTNLENNKQVGYIT